jgi:hypothetical protein
MIMGGRYQEGKHTGNFMGMPFEGYSLTGYDNARKVFVTSWIDNMGTGIMYMEGKWDEKTKTVHFVGKSTDPSTGKEVPVRQTFTWIDPNKQKMEMFMTQAGKEYKNMEIVLTRKEKNPWQTSWTNSVQDVCFSLTSSHNTEDQ